MHHSEREPTLEVRNKKKAPLRNLFVVIVMERAKGLEPSAPSLGSWCSTIELHPLISAHLIITFSWNRRKPTPRKQKRADAPPTTPLGTFMVNRRAGNTFSLDTGSATVDRRHHRATDPNSLFPAPGSAPVPFAPVPLLRFPCSGFPARGSLPLRVPLLRAPVPPTEY